MVASPESLKFCLKCVFAYCVFCVASLQMFCIWTKPIHLISDESFDRTAQEAGVQCTAGRLVQNRRDSFVVTHPPVPTPPLLLPNFEEEK